VPHEDEASGDAFTMERNLLLCELHAHTTWSDGDLTVTEVVDLYGRSGFDVLCITDHAYPGPRPVDLRLDADSFPHYLNAIDREARRAREQYDLLVIPGLELTYDAEDGHALAVGARCFSPVRPELADALAAVRDLGAATVAAHPTVGGWFWRNRLGVHELVDRYELINRRQTFGWVAEAGLPAVASGDFHQLDQLATWKTVLPCRKEEEDVVQYLRSGGRAYVVPWHLGREEAA